ncbi:hypothetical protein [Pseudomonas palleroniana]
MTEQQYRKILIAKLFDADVTEVLAASAINLDDAGFFQFYKVLVEEQDYLKETVQKAKASKVKAVAKSVAKTTVHTVTLTQETPQLTSAELTMQMLRERYKK